MNKKKFIIPIIIGLMVFSISLIVYFYQLFFSPNFNLNHEKVFVYIYPQETAKDIAKRLQKQRVLHDMMSFLFITRVLGYGEELKVGRYALQKKTSNLEAIQIFRSGTQPPIRIVLHPKRTVREYVSQLCKPLLLEEDVFWDYFKMNWKALGFDEYTIPAFFIPDSYDFYWNISKTHLLKKLKEQYDNFWNQERRKACEKIKLTPIEVSTLASIIDAETKQNSEKRKIAGLYMNRLKINKPLEADPSIIFALQDFSIRRVLNKYLSIESPYNTYKYKGLPPGPIRIPTKEAIEATLHYEKHNYLFMCAKDDFSGFHNFASTYREHKINAKKFRKALNKLKIYN